LSANLILFKISFRLSFKSKSNEKTYLLLHRSQWKCLFGESQFSDRFAIIQSKLDDYRTYFFFQYFTSAMLLRSTENYLVQLTEIEYLDGIVYWNHELKFAQRYFFFGVFVYLIIWPIVQKISQNLDNKTIIKSITYLYRLGNLLKH
jgi:hypothetical protein